QGIVIAHEDITERKQAEMVQREKADLQEQLAKIATSVPGLICSFRLRPDGSACFPYASPHHRRNAWSYCGGGSDGRCALFARIHPDDLGHVNATIAES
ncbi:MAG: hypothetical protein IPL59_23710, partial [Candidatus Competibacteraceae bacterium]|nr:hypothetical protein [Candidatus Competibacteraceae bacterium]